MKEITSIRSLMVADRDLITGLIEKAGHKIGDKSFQKMIRSGVAATSSKNDGDGADIGFAIGVELIQFLIGVLGTDMRAWFSDLVGVSADEFVKLPFYAEPRIINLILESPEIKSFFSEASQLRSWIEKLQSRLSGAKEKSGLPTV